MHNTVVVPVHLKRFLCIGYRLITNVLPCAVVDLSISVLVDGEEHEESATDAQLPAYDSGAREGNRFDLARR
jgi:hypothetical protein